MDGAIDAPYLTVNTVQIGHATFRQVTARLDGHDAAFLASQVAMRGARGYVGASLFEGYQVIVDYQRQELTLIPPGNASVSRNVCRGVTVPLLPAPDIGLVGAVQSNIGDAQFAWDTSAQASMIIKRRLLTSHVETSKDFVTLKPFSLNGQDLGPLEMNIVNFDAPSGLDGIIGDNFFTGHVVCFDFPGKRVLIRQS